MSNEERSLRREAGSQADAIVKRPLERLGDAGIEAARSLPLVGPVVGVLVALVSRTLSSQRLVDFLNHVQARLDRLPEDTRRQCEEWLDSEEGRETIEVAIRANDAEAIADKRKLYANLVVNACNQGGAAPLYELSLLQRLTREHISLLAAAAAQRSDTKTSLAQCDLEEMPFLESAFYDLEGWRIFDVSFVTMDGYRPRPDYQNLGACLTPAGLRLVALLGDPAPQPEAPAP